jgi:hypothetical protein
MASLQVRVTYSGTTDLFKHVIMISLVVFTSPTGCFRDIGKCGQTCGQMVPSCTIFPFVNSLPRNPRYTGEGRTLKTGEMVADLASLARQFAALRALLPTADL